MSLHRCELCSLRVAGFGQNVSERAIFGSGHVQSGSERQFGGMQLSHFSSDVVGGEEVTLQRFSCATGGVGRLRVVACFTRGQQEFLKLFG